jgi:hypothetical protein
MKNLIIIAALLTLAACSSVPTKDETDAIACAAAVAASGAADPAILAIAAATNPSCQALAADAVHAIIAEASKIQLQKIQLQKASAQK